MSTVPPPDKLKPLAAELLQAAAKPLPLDTTRRVVHELFRSYSPLAVTRSHHQIWYRARVCDSTNGFSNVRQMLYPPNGSTEYGRASMPGSKVLYAGWNVRLSLEEVGAKKGNTVQIICVRVRTPVEFPCVIIGEHQAIFNSGRSIVNSPKLEQAFSERLQKQLDKTLADVFVDSVVADLFRQRHESNELYSSCAVIAEMFLSRGIGLIYPSVRTAHAVNLALRSEEFDSTFEVLSSEVFDVLDYHGYGLYALKPTNSTLEISPDGDFVWDSTRRTEFRLGERRDMLISPDFRGWRAK